MAIYNWVSKLIRDWFVFGLLRSVISWLWLKTRAAFSTNRGFVASVFPRFWQFRCFYLKFSLALKGIWYRPLWLLWVWFYDIKSKSALVFGFVLHRVGDDFSKPFRGSHKHIWKNRMKKNFKICLRGNIESELICPNVEHFTKITW